MSADLTMWSSGAWSSAADVYLLDRSREGSAEAFGELWRRHLPAAYSVAGKYRGRTAAEDIVAEASTRVFALIQQGRGPDEHFRSYFLSAVRTVAIDHSRRDLRVVPAPDDELEDLAEPVLETTGDDFDPDLVRTAFRGLSERDQRVLWHTTVEGSAPRAVASALGMTANAVSVRAMRAREALRAHYLDACADRGAAAADTDECRWAIAHLGALVRGRLPKRQTERVEAHLAACPHAAALADNLRAIHEEFPALIVPLIFVAGLSTPGFVSGAAVAGLTTVSAVGGAAASSGAASGAAAAAAVVPPASPLDAFGELASRTTTVAAGVALAAGLAGVAQVTVPVANPVAAPRPSATSTPQPPAVVPPAPAPPAAVPVSPSAVPQVAPPPVASAPASSPAPPTSVPTQAPKPTPRPTPTPSTNPPAPTPVLVTARIIRSGTDSTMTVRVHDAPAGETTIVLTNVAGGTLTAKDNAWDCTQLSAASVRCTGMGSQLRVVQAGTGGPTPIRATVTDSTGVTRTQTVTPYGGQGQAQGRAQGQP